MSDQAKMCAEVLEHLALILDGDEKTLERFADHLAECDACRDIRYDAALAAELVPHAGADYEPPSDLEKRVLETLDARGDQSVRSTIATEQSSLALADTVEVVAPQKDTTSSETTRPPSASKESKSGVFQKAHKNVVYLVMGSAAVLLVCIGGIGYTLSRSKPAESGSVASGSGIQSGSQENNSPTGTRATIVQIVRAASDNNTGITARSAGENQFTPVSVDTEIGPGATIRTDERTRARLALSDGSTLVLNHNTELTIDGQTERLLRIAAGGEVLAEIAHLEQGPQAVFATPTGRVEVLGTKFLVTTTEENATVRVTRGAVRVYGNSGSQSEVKSGEEAMIPRQGAVTVAPAINLAGSVTWSEMQGEDVERSVSGMGELRAKLPGEREESERPLNLTSHKVKVRIVGNVARTEVEEVFRNDSAVTLEGIYRFPLPPDARIARLALEVEGHMEEGAFVERDQAAKIWRGVIRRATPQSQRQPQEEFIWVPGPWRDPALLEWQQGGQFQLRIFPIKAHSERRVILAYEQTVEPHAKGRRYVYPLAHSADDSTRVGVFDVDIRVAGADTNNPIKAHNYQFQPSNEGAATRLRMTQGNFIPAGDIVIDYQMAGGSQEMRYWTYQGAAAAAPSVEARPGSTRGSSQDVVSAQQALANDNRSYVVFAIRPELPVQSQNRPRDYVLIVDSSQSMVGERFGRVTQLVTGIVAEMDRRDRFTILACDATCQAKPGEPRTPSAEAAIEVQQWLGQIRPAGATDLISTLSDAANAARQSPQDRDVRVIYIGDGVASVGHRSAAAITSHMRTLAQSSNVTYTTVGVGGDADTVVLSAIAHTGGGHYVRYIPGQRTSATALRVLETTYGISLRNARLELPLGVTDVAPASLNTIRAGEEVVVTARFTGEIQGEVVLRGTVGGQEYVDRYPVTLTPSASAGNAFVPRLWAAQTINSLELRGDSSARNRIVALSRGYGVMSRHTSLLVLESEAMFRAFRIDRARPSVDWTGEDEMDSSESQGTETHSGATVLDGVASNPYGVGQLRGGAGGGSASGLSGRAARRRSAASATRSQAPAASRGPSRAADLDDVMAEAAPRPSPTRSTTRAPSLPQPRRDSRGGQWMRRVWERVGSVNTNVNEKPRDRQRVFEAETALVSAPDSRDRHRDLYRALARVGDLERAREIAEQWISRDQLDPEALVALSDVLGRQGYQDDSLRLLTGIVDLEPDNRELHQRIAEAYERAGDVTRACSHRIAMAESDGADVNTIAAAVRCERALGHLTLATLLLDTIAESRTRVRVERAITNPPGERGVQGDVMLEASWSGPLDLDLSLINSRGQRISWMGGRNNVVGDSARIPGRERLGIRWTPVGTYFIEVSRTDPTDTRPIAGTITVRALRARNTIHFNLLGPRAQVGSVQVRRESRMVPAGF